MRCNCIFLCANYIVSCVRSEQWFHKNIFKISVIFFGLFSRCLAKIQTVRNSKVCSKDGSTAFFFAQKHRVKYLRIQWYCYAGICSQGFYKIQLLFEGFTSMMNSKVNGS